MTALEAAQATLKRWVAKRQKARNEAARANRGVKRWTKKVKVLTRPHKPPSEWMPGVPRDAVASIGRSTVGAKAGLLHTTEGLDFDVMDRVLKQKRACPHFLVGRAGQLKQYRPIWDAATALENPPGGVETNRKRLVQIEVCAFAGKPNEWPLAQKQAVAKIMAFCRGHGVPLQSSVTFTDAQHVKRLSGPAWVAYRGWLGHQHAPEQPSGHWDPGAVDINVLLALARAL